MTPCAIGPTSFLFFSFDFTIVNFDVFILMNAHNK